MMKNNKSVSRRRFLGLVGGVTAGSLLAACTPGSTSSPAAPSATAPAAQVEATAVQNATQAAPSLPEVELSYIYPGGAQKDLQLIQDELSRLVKAKINATVKLVPVDWGAFDEKIKLANASGEKYDIQFTAPWINNYYQNISKGALTVLDDLLVQNAPGLWASMSPATWDAARVMGKIYGVINKQIHVKGWGAYIRKDLAEKYNLDFAAAQKYEDLEPFMEAVKQGEGITPLYCTNDIIGSAWKAEYYMIDPIIELSGNGTLIGIRYNDQELKAFLVPESPEYKEGVDLARKWYLAGYYPETPLPPADAAAAYKAGKYAIQLHIYKPGVESELKASFGFDFLAKAFKKGFLTTAGVTATMNAISRTSANPERAIMLLELFNTDKEIYNLICKGIENKHWVWADKEKQVIGFPPGLDSGTSGYNPNTDWMFGNQFNAYYVSQEQADADVWKATDQMNKSAEPSVALGFAFVSDPVQAELTAVGAIVQQYHIQLALGQVDSAEILPEYTSKLKEAGAEKIMAEVQKQLDAWKATR